MTKQEKIKEAYGDAYEALYPYIDINGWVRSANIHFYLPNKLPFKSDTIVMDGRDWYRPLELQGISDNNGWTKIESVSDLPVKAGYYKTCGNYIFDEKKNPFHESSDFYYNGKMWQSNNLEICFKWEITHWRPIIENLKPIY